MSRIPVFVERQVGRRNWAKGAKPCIFIARESLQSSSDLDFEKDDESRGCCSHDQSWDHLVNLAGVKKPNQREDKLLRGQRKDFDSSVSETSSAQNGTSDSFEGTQVVCFSKSFGSPKTGIIKVVSETIQKTGTNKIVSHNIEKEATVKDTSLSLAVVSCSKGVVNSSCNCTLCNSSSEQTESSAVGVRRLQRYQSNGVGLKGPLSMIPQPRRFVPGTVTMTPAPVKRSKLRSKTEPKPRQGKETCNTKNNVTAEKVDTLDNGIKETNTIAPDNQTESIKLSGKITTNVADDTCNNDKVITIGEQDEVVVNIDDDKTVVNGDTDNVHVSVDDADTNVDNKTSVVTSVNKSKHYFEDSEPEYAQHEMQKAQSENTHTVSLLAGVSLDTEEHPGDISKLSVDMSHTESCTESVIQASVTPVTRASSIPVIMSRTQSSAHGENSTSTVAVDSTSTEASVVLATNTLAATPAVSSFSLTPTSSVTWTSSVSKLPVKTVPAFSSFSTGSVVSSIPRASSQSPQRSVQSRVTLKRPRSASRPDGCAKGMPKQDCQKSKQSVCKNVKIAVIQRDTHCEAASGSTGAQSGAGLISPKRNLPKAPSEIRRVKYGQMCSLAGEESDNAAVSKPPTTNSHASRPPPGGSNAASAAGSKGKKRPAWDLKGQLEDMKREKQAKEGQITGFMSEMSKITERIEILEQTNTHLSGKVAKEEEQKSHASRRNTELTSKLQETEDELGRVKRNYEQTKADYEFTRASLQRQKESLEAELAAGQQEIAGLKVSLAQLTSSQAQVHAELDSTKLSLEKSLQYGKEKDTQNAELLAMVADYKLKSQDWEKTRRQLHNSIQELKGNIRVFCRVRPLLGEELLSSDGEMHHMHFPENDDKAIELQKLSEISLSESTMCGVKRDGKGRYAFSFDKVFTPGSSQSEVFEEISQLVQSALDGYNVCIFAYGQTGSGKTYTMEGPSVEDEESRGMISRAVSQIFLTTRELEENSWQYQFEASFLEIYNETIRDLLGNHGNDVKHDIKLGTNGNDVSVTNLTYIPVTQENQILDLLKMASKNRAVGETLCNERSSRSHSVFRLKITGSNNVTGETCKGTLNLVDLAGSERLKESGATGQRLKETQNINKSLSNLGNVIMALANKESHVPFRNSRLTYLLQNSLGGNSKTLMFVNASPREENFSETLNSLRFATKVNQCNIGTATKKMR